MSKASTSRTIKFIQKVGTYSAMIMSPSGDLFQDFEGPAEAPTKFFPDWTTAESKPVLNLVVTSSRVTEVVKLSGIKYHFNGTEIQFGSDNVSTGLAAGLFKKIPMDGTHPYHGIQILKNLVVAAAGASCTIKIEGHVGDNADGNDIIGATYTIPIQQATGKSLRCTIIDISGNSFVLRSGAKVPHCLLEAHVYEESTELKTGLTYEWYKMSGGQWVVIADAVGQQLKVEQKDVDTYGDFMVKVKPNGKDPVTDTQSVLDASDPFDIDPTPNPMDETIIEGSKDKLQVTYNPKLVKRGGGIVTPQPKFIFTVRDSHGNILNRIVGETPVPSDSVTVDLGMAQQAGGDMSLVIETAEEQPQA